MKIKLLIYTLFAVFVLLGCSGKTGNKSEDYIIIQGFAQGTYYRVTYHDKKHHDLKPEIEELLRNFERSLSVYDSTSIISKVNRNENVELDDYFINLFNRAVEINKQTNGAFDMSGEPLYLAWGFSRKNKEPMNAHKVDSLMQYVGMDKIRIEDRRVVKLSPNVVINGNAVAKGYSTDVVAKYLDSKGYTDYLVDIGGEMHMKGKNRNGDSWNIAIDTPTDGNYEPGADIQVLLALTNKGLATSGNYRRFYVEDGKKIGHTINPVTGYPTSHNLLSSTVVANDCLTADAFATAFLVVGLDSAIRMVEKYPELDAYFIYADGDSLKTYYTDGMEKYIVKQKNAE